MANEIALNYDLLKARKWREFLITLPEGRTQFDVSFQTLGEMKSFKATAYELNSDGIHDKVFSLSLNKADLIATVTVRKRGE